MIFPDLISNISNEVVKAILLVIIGIFLGVLANFVIKKLSQYTIYKWIGKQPVSSRKKVKLWVNIAAIIIEWLIIFLFIFQALSIYNITIINEVFRLLISFTPKIIVALLILAIGLILSSIISRKIKNLEFKNSDLVSGFVEWLLITATILSSLEILNIQITPFMVLFKAAVYAIALVFAIAIGIALGITLKPQLSKIVKELTS